MKIIELPAFSLWAHGFLNLKDVVVSVVKYVTVFFDLEGKYGCPYNISEPQFKRALKKILEILDRYQVKAVFNTCGRLAKDFPNSIEAVHSRGHEIASHGYMHEDFLGCNSTELIEILEKTEETIGKAIGEKPVGIRSPGLSMNLFSPKKKGLKKKFYSTLELRGYKWSSNCCMWPLFQTNYTCTKIISKICSNPFKIPLFGMRPLKLGHLFEIPVLSPQDFDLLNPLTHIEMKTPNSRIRAVFIILKEYFNVSGDYFNLNLHPWVIGSSNRPTLLRYVLDYLSDQDVRYVLPRQFLKNQLVNSHVID